MRFIDKLACRLWGHHLNQGQAGGQFGSCRDLLHSLRHLHHKEGSISRRGARFLSPAAIVRLT